MRAAILGLGKLGLPIALFYSSKGHDVIGIDIIPETIEKLRNGESPIDETGVQELLDKQKGSIKFSTDMNLIKDVDIVCIVVGTPCKEDGSIDLQYIKSACEQIGDALKENRQPHLIINKSTAPPGTLRNLIKPTIVEHSQVEHNIHVYAYSPEYIALGRVLRDLEYPRPGYAAIGELSRSAGERLIQFLDTIYQKGSVEYLRTTPENIEVIKYVSNAYFTTKIAFINLVADMCQRIPNSDANIVSKVLGRDPRISPEQFSPGLGFGGPCFPKDLKQVTAFLREREFGENLFSAVLDENTWHSLRLVTLIRSYLEPINGKTVVIMGSSYKPNTHLEVESPARVIGEDLESIGANVRYFNPPGDPPLDNADAAIICAPWDEFYKIKPNEYGRRMARPLVIDLTRVYGSVMASKVEYVALGLGPYEK